MPFTVRGNLVSGPGVFDMKGGLVQLVFALKALQALSLRETVIPVAFLNSDEEIGSRESTRYIATLARLADRAYVLEPSLGPAGAIKTARKGVGRYTVSVTGRAAHAGLDPEEGISAILELSFLIQKLFALNETGASPIDAPEALINEELPPELREVFFTDGDRALSFIEADVALSTGEHLQTPSQPDLHTGARVTLALRPEKISLHDEPVPGHNNLPCTMVDSVYTGSMTTFHIALAGNAHWMVRQQNQALQAQKTIPPGTKLVVSWPVEACKAFVEEEETDVT